MPSGTQVRRVLLQINADDGDTEAKLDRIAARADELGKKHPELQVKIDTAAAAAKLAVLRADLKDIGKTITPEIKPKLDAAAAAEAKAASAAAGTQAGGGFLSGFTPAAGGIGAGVVTALAVLPGVAGLAGTGMGVAMIGGMAAVVAKSVYANVAPAVNAYQTALNTVGQAHASAMKQFASYYNALSGSQQHLVDTVTVAENAWQGFIQSNTAGMTKILSQGMGLLPHLFSGMSGILQQVLPQMSGILKTLSGTLDGFLGVMKASAPAFGPMISSLLQMVNNVMPGLQTIIKATTPAFSIFAQVLTGLGSTLGRTFAALAPGVRASGQVLLGLGRILGALLPAIGTLATSLARALAPAFGSLASIVRTLAPVLARLGGDLAQLAGAGLSIVLGAVAKLLPPLAQLVNVFLKGLEPVIPPVIRALQQMANAATGPLVSALQKSLPYLGSLVSTLLDLLQKAIIPNLPALAKITGALIQVATSGVLPLLPPILQLGSVLLGLADKVITPLLPLLTTLANAFAQAASAASQFMSLLSNIPGIGGWFSGGGGGPNIGALIGPALNAVTGGGGSLGGGGGSFSGGSFGGGGSYAPSLGGAPYVPSLAGIASGINTGPTAARARATARTAARAAGANLALILSQGIMQGLTGSAGQVQGAISKLLGAVNTDVSGKYISTSEGTEISRWLEGDQNKLVSLANRRAAILARIQQADAYAKQITTSTESTFGVVTAAQSITPALGVGGIMHQLLGDVAQIRVFTQNIAKLRRMGLNKAYIDQIIQAGPVAGGQVAAELAVANEGDIRGINKAESQIAQASASLGQTAANAMYDSGKMAGKGFLSGLQAQQSQLEAAMKRLADVLVNTIKRELKIHSPSQVAYDLFAQVPAGGVLAINDGHTAMTAASARMARAAVSGRAAAAGGSAGGGGHFTFEWVGGSADQALITLLKRHIRITGGNPAVLGA